MFFLKVLKHRILLPPTSFSASLKHELERKLYSEVEGTCSGRYGFIVSIVGIDEIGKGVVNEGRGSAEFIITYKAVVFKPFKGEVVEATVTTVNKMGFFADCGPVTIFVSNHLIPQELEFINNTYTNSVDHTIQKGEWLRIKIVGTRVDAKEIFAIGTIKEDYLGLIEEEL